MQEAQIMTNELLPILVQLCYHLIYLQDIIPINFVLRPRHWGSGKLAFLSEVFPGMRDSRGNPPFTAQANSTMAHSGHGLGHVGH